MEGTLSQPYIFALAMYIGMAMGVLYSLARLTARLFGGGRVVTAVTDTLFAVILMAATALLLYYAMDMQLSFYCFAALALGFLLYMLAISPLARFVYCKFFVRRVDKGGKKSSNSR